MKNVTFYSLNQYSNIDALIVIEQIVCNLVANKWREGKKILIACEDNSQALRLDEALWVYNPNAFIPHNLSKEKLKYDSPVEIYWPKCYFSNKPRDLLINLLPIYIDFVITFHEIVDFIPNKNNLKKLARNRYKAYRNVGFQLIVTKPSRQIINEINKKNNEKNI